MTLKRREYHVDCHAKKAAIFCVACEPNPATRVKIPDAIRIKGYSPSKAANQALQMQVHHKAEKIKGEAGPGSPADKVATASLLLALATVATTARPALQTIAQNQTIAPIVLPSPERKVRKTLHQAQIGKQNERKRKAVHAQAHARATTLVAKERAMPKDGHQTTMQAIAQVEGDFRARGYGVTRSKNTINRYVALGMVGTFPLVRGYVDTMPRHAFDLLMLAVESFIQICNINSIDAERSKLMMAINMCCGVAPSECRTKHSIYDRVMRLTNVLLNADVSPAVEERCVRWATCSNLDAWFVNFWVFLVEFNFAGVGDNGELTFTEEQKR
jgi:hypothetical protein